MCFTRNGCHHLCSPSLSLQRWGDGGGGRHTDISRERGGVVHQSREEGSRRGVDLLNQFLQLGVVYHTHKHITQDGEEDPSLLESSSTDDVINRQGVCNCVLTYVYNAHQYLHMYIGPSQMHQNTHAIAHIFVSENFRKLRKIVGCTHIHDIIHYVLCKVRKGIRDEPKYPLPAFISTGLPLSFLWSTLT